MKFTINKQLILFITMLGVSLGGSQAAFSQANESSEAEERNQIIEEIMVTGTASKKRTTLESTYGLSILDSAEMEKEAAITGGIAELLDSQPGIYGESYGGEANTAINARGIRENFPTFISIQEDGLPIIYSPFFQELHIRHDASIGRVETILGGPSGVFTAQGSSATVNFISRIPDQREGDIAFSLTDDGTVRTDFFIGGPINDEWTATVGGFYRRGEGVRDVGYTGNRGGQIRANIVKKLGSSDQGKATLSLKAVDDNTVFYTPQPVNFSEGVPKPIPGLDPRDEALNGPDVRRLNMKTATDGVKPIDLDEGVDVNTLQASFKLEWNFDNGIRIKNHSRIVDIDTDNHDLRGGDSTSIFRATEFIDNNSQALFDAFPNAVATRLVRERDNKVIENPDALNGNGLLTRQNSLSYRKHHSNFINELEAIYSNRRVDATLGFQFWDMESRTRYIQSDFLLDVRGKANRMDLEAVDSEGNVVGHFTDNGILTHGSLNNGGTWDVESRNIYANIELSVTDKLRFDTGFRYENVDHKVSGLDVDINVPLPDSLNDPKVLADDVAFIEPNGNVVRGHNNLDDVTWTVGASYTLMENLAIYARFTDAHDFGFSGLEFAYFNVPGFGVPEGNNLNMTDGASNLEFAEIGARWQSPSIAFFATAFYTENKDISQRIRLPNGVLSENEITTEALGIEFQGTWFPSDLFSLDLSGVVQDVEVDDPDGFQDGLSVNRLPETQLRARVNYHFNKGTAYIALSHIGNRPANNANSIYLPGDQEINAGIIYNFNETLQFSVQGKNLTDALIPQTGALDNNAGDILNPEFLFAGHQPGRRFKATVKWSFF